MTQVAYRWVWKWIGLDWSEFFNFYWEDFNPNVPSIPNRTTASAYEETSSFNLSGFQPWNEVGCYVRQIDLTENGRLDVEIDLQYYSWWWQTCWDFSWRTTVDVKDYDSRMWYAYFGIDDDEIWTYSNQYRIVMNWEFTVWWSHVAWESWLINTFTINSLSIDDTRHSAWYFWVEGNYLCYIDGVWGNRWFKHKINYDSWYNWGSWSPWYVWIPSSSGDNHIYYVAANWTVRRTHYSSAWYGGNYYPSWARPWAIRVSNGSYEDWYWYLCYINSWWQARRMWNWAP
jgi:hypothetical protein